MQVILTSAEETSATSVLVSTNPHYLITEDWDIANRSASHGLLVEDLVDRLSMLEGTSLRNRRPPSSYSLTRSLLAFLSYDSI